jgi:hypothetical protein
MSNVAANIGRWLGALTLLLGTVAGMQAADESKTAVQLFKAIGADAVQVRSAAASLNKMTADPAATWEQYDRQWNQIQPAVEDMQIRIARLEKMETAISPAERADVERSKQLIQQIRNRTRDFLALLDKPGVQTMDARFKTYAKSLLSEAGKLDTASRVS